jgi:hypothetical protein
VIASIFKSISEFSTHRFLNLLRSPIYGARFLFPFKM